MTNNFIDHRKTCDTCNVKYDTEKTCMVCIDCLNLFTEQGFKDGFNACIEMVQNILDNYDSNELAKYSVWDFIEQFKQDLIENVELYKIDG